MGDIKTKHRKMWALGDYPALAGEIIWDLGGVLTQEAGVGSGDRVLDIAAGSGNAAIAAAQTGATVVASDLTPELLEAGRKQAARQGITLEWQEADAEALPFKDAEFDAVISCVGIMFAPQHQAAADEMIRVCRPGGTIGLLNWTPEGFIGQMFATMKPYAPPPPPGAQPPPLWGDPDYVRTLLGDRVTDLKAHRQKIRITGFETPEAFRDYFKARYGPTIAVYNHIADDPEKTAALDEALTDLARRHDQKTSTLTVDWEYLLLIVRKNP
ncbi:class I SAM-dependent methyltransferase [Actinomadura sp. 7K507]|uniref:class I SAM-dependent methyltransferase n=1 Tax=Actinomadura sp. 7K507 TaxID=2530365 RepID=UPI00104DC4F8|nr:class I SAM-dependent methyltransferase [Actinomadura sp. 7K507]TDC83672.1 class I SAM-dependent methyltransferase [Actinomadura sp. 7K507]